MKRITKKQRQQMVTAYLAETGRDTYVPAEFLAWLEPRVDHPLWPRFYGRDDAELAGRWRLAEARRLVSDLRITVRIDKPQPVSISGIVARYDSFPAFVAPLDSRVNGGGFHRISAPPTAADLDMMAEEAATALDGWLRRYRGTLAARGIDPAIIDHVAGHLRADPFRIAAE